MDHTLNNESVLSIIFDNTHTLVAYLDTELRFVQVNRAYAAADCKDPDFFVGKKHFDLFPNRENQALFQRVLDTGEPHFSYAKPFVYERNPERGTSHWDWSLVPARNDAGQVTGAVLQLVDVSERIRSEEKLRVEQDFSSAVLAAANALIVVLDSQGRIQRFNRACEKVTGYSFPDVENKHVWDFLPADEEVESIKEAFREITESSLPEAFSGAWVGKDGAQHLINWNSSLVPDENGKIRFIVLVGVDITDKQNIIEKLDRSRDVLGTAQSIARIGTWDWDIVDNRLDWSEEIYRIFGVEPDGFGATYEHFLQFVHAEDRPAVERAVKASLASPENIYQVDHRIVRTDGETGFVKESGKVYFDHSGKPVRMVGIVQDVTRENLVRDELRRKEQTLSDAQAIAHVGNWDWDIESSAISWSDEIFRIFGYEPGAFLPTYEAFLQAIHKDDRDKVRQAVNESLQDPSRNYHIEHRVITPNNETRIVQEDGRVYLDGQGKPVRMIGTVQDITELKQANQALEYSQVRFRAMFESMIDSVIVADTQRRILLVNRATLGQFGYREDELIGKQTVVLYADVADFQKTGKERYNENAAPSEKAYEVRYRRKDGSVFWGETLGSTIESEEGSLFGFVGVIRDVSRRKYNEQELQDYRERLEELVEDRTRELVATQNELVRKERLATLGQLTATVSHELRNPLAAMRPSLYIVQRSSDTSSEKVQQALSRLDRNINRCDHIIDELLDFTRITALEMKEIVLDDWIRQLILELDIPTGIEVIDDLNLGKSRVAIDAHRLRRAMINVIENGFHAMQEEGGRIVKKGIAELTVFTRERNGNIELGVRDTGSGIADDVLPHIFEPLYSTKGFGVGLGMPTVKQIIEQHGGNVDIETAESVGTTVRFILPHRDRTGEEAARA